MYFWNIGKLKEDIRSDNLTEKERFFYALVHLSLGAIFLEMVGYSSLASDISNDADVLSSATYILTVIVGTILAFKANGANGGVDFLGRYFSIGFVMDVRFLAYAVPSIAVYVLFVGYMVDVVEVLVSYVGWALVFGG